MTANKNGTESWLLLLNWFRALVGREACQQHP
jgi:hypothetical protein